MLKGAVVGLGKMGLSHQAILSAHPRVDLVAICDSSSYLRDVISKYTGVEGYGDYEKMLDQARPDFILIATPSKYHSGMVRAALERGIHVFCEKPFCLTGREGEELADIARSRGLVTQVGYHNRFVGAFQELKRVLDVGAIGDVTHVLAEAYGPVVLEAKGGSWRSKADEGGGCLYDYAAHPINLVNWYLGPPTGVGGTVLNKIFSREIEDEVSSTLYYPGGRTAQISVNWSDDSVRKMTTRITVWGTQGRVFADRQECQVYLRTESSQLPDYRQGWNVRYTTDLTEPVSFYLRGEEYSAQLDHFLKRVAGDEVEHKNDFESAVVTDQVIERMIEDAATAGRRAPAVAVGVAFPVATVRRRSATRFTAGVAAARSRYQAIRAERSRSAA